MKLKYDFETVELGDDYVSVPIGERSNTFHGVIKLNKEGMEIFNLLKTDISEESIVNILASKYENNRETISDYVSQAIKRLREIGVIEE